MSVKYQSYPTLTTDEPAIYEDFTGGINTDPSNEHLMPNELRDCVNMTYQSGALVKRRGAKEIAKLICKDNLFNIQGIFLFTYRITYLIIAADGKLYYGVFNENSSIFLDRLKIQVTPNDENLFYDPTYMFNNFKEKYSTDTSERHEGYIHSYELINGKENDYYYVGNFTDMTNNIIYKNDVITYMGIKYKYIKQKEFTKVVATPLNYTTYWTPISKEEAYSDGRIKVNEWKEQEQNWKINDIVKYQKLYYRCNINHSNYPNLNIYDKETWQKINEQKELIFQNYRNIEAATFNNKLYIATGTRFVNVLLRNNQLIAEPVTPYRCNNTEIINIGYNYLSPYPEYCRASQTNTVTTSIGGILPIKTKTGMYILEPQMNFQMGETAKDYLYRWEKKINNKWYVIHTFKSQDTNYYKDTSAENDYSTKILNTLIVSDADKYQYRVTFANSFDKEDTFIANWNNKTTYKKGNYVSVGPDIYECLIEHTPSHKLEDEKNPGNIYTIYKGKDTFDHTIEWDNATGEFSEFGYVISHTKDSNNASIENKTLTQFWKILHKQEAVTIFNEQTKEVSLGYDYAIDKVTGGYFGQGISTLAYDLKENDMFNIIQTCTKIHTDGNKLLLYDDRYNSGQWFKTIINNPSYITDRGSLKFKTTKNEAIIKVVAFQGNIIVFANSEKTGGSIHLVQGNGDDYDSKDGYYSPYRRRTINSSISCDNSNTIQICDNLLVFKYFNRIYYINASELNNDVIQVTPCNDRLLHNSNNIIIPWDNNNCVSEVTDSYYGLIWKEKYEADKNGNLILIHPGLRLKMYYKMRNRLPDGNLEIPWLRDESEYLNVEHCIYIKGKPIFLYNNILVSFNENCYQDINEDFPITIHFRGVDCNYPKLYKMLDNIIIYYHRNQYSKINLELKSLNESGHLLIDTSNSSKSLQNLKILKADDPINNDKIRLDSTILDTKVINSTYKFPYLLIDTVITGITKGEFSLSSITYNYNSLDSLTTNPYDLYTSIIRKKDLTTKETYKGGK